MVAPLADLGAYFSFPGCFLAAGKERQRETFKAVPADRLLLETDAPDQPGSAHRGARNEPAYLTDICAVIAELRSEDPIALAAQTTRNASRLFGLTLD